MLLLAALIKGLLVGVPVGLGFIGWFFTRGQKTPAVTPPHTFAADLPLLGLAGMGSALLTDALWYGRGAAVALIEHALPIVILALVFAVMNEMRRRRTRGAGVS